MLYSPLSSPSKIIHSNSPDGFTVLSVAVSIWRLLMYITLTGLADLSVIDFISLATWFVGCSNHMCISSFSPETLTPICESNHCHVINVECLYKILECSSYFIYYYQNCWIARGVGLSQPRMAAPRWILLWIFWIIVWLHRLNKTVEDFRL